MFEQDLTAGSLLFTGDPSSVTPVAVTVKLPRNGRGWAYLHVKIAAHASDTCTVGVQGRLNSSGGFVTLKQSDQSTATSIAQSAGAATESITTVQLMPEMKVVLSGTRTSGAVANVWVEAITAAARTDS